jgi:hypothetical protein
MSKKALAEATSKDLVPRQHKAIAALLAGHNTEGAAAAAEVKPATIRAWMKEGDFREELRLGQERVRQAFESRLMIGAQKGLGVVYKAMDHPNLDTQLEASKIMISSAVRIANRYKELQVEGYIAPAVPLVIFPVGTKLPWANKQLPPAIPVTQFDDEAIDVEATEVEEGKDE